MNSQLEKPFAWLKEQASDLLGDLATPARTLLIALTGVWLSTLMFAERWCAVIAIGVVGIVAGYVLESRAGAHLPKKPARALAWMEWWIVAPATIAAVAAGLATYLGFKLVPEQLTGANEEIAKAFAAAITAFLSASFVTTAGDKDNSQLAGRIKRRFHAAYQHLATGSAAETAVFSGSRGWGWEDRRTRIKNLTEALANKIAMAEETAKKKDVEPPSP